MKRLQRLPWGSALTIILMTAIVTVDFGSIVGALAFWGLVILYGAFMALCWLMGQNDLVFTFVKEGTGKIILRGGSFDHVMISSEHLHLNHPRLPHYDKDLARWDILPNAPDTTRDDYDNRPWFMRTLGLFWLGIIPGVYSVYRYPFAWNELRTKKGGGDEIRSRDTRDEGGTTDFFYVSDFNYVFKLEDAETDGNFPVNLISINTIAIENPYQAFFGGEDWLRRTGAAVNGVGRMFVASRNFDQVREDGSKVDKDDKRIPGYPEAVLALNDRLEGEDLTLPGPHGLRGRYGIRNKAVEIQDIIPAGQNAKELEKLLQERARARIQKDVDITVSEGKAQANLNLAEAEAKGIKMRMDAIKSDPHIGLILAQLDAMAQAEQHGKTVIWANMPWLNGVGNGIGGQGFADFLQSEGITAAQFAEWLRKNFQGNQGAAA